MADMEVRRVYDHAGRRGGTTLLVDRVWPRGHHNAVVIREYARERLGREA